MFVSSCIRAPGAIVLRQVWTYVIKHYGKRKSINTCDGYTLIGKVVKYAEKYVAYAHQHGFNIFIALYTALGYIIMAGEDINVYAQAPSQYERFYLHVEDLYI